MVSDSGSGVQGDALKPGVLVFPQPHQLGMGALKIGKGVRRHILCVFGSAASQPVGVHWRQCGGSAWMRYGLRKLRRGVLPPLARYAVPLLAGQRFAQIGCGGVVL